MPVFRWLFLYLQVVCKLVVATQVKYFTVGFTIPWNIQQPGRAEVTMSTEHPAPGSETEKRPEEVNKGPDDAELTAGPRNMQQMAAQRRLQQTQAQVDEVVDLMRANVDNVLKRDNLLTDLELRSEGLEAGASLFETQAKSLKNKFWLENLKMIIAGGLVSLIIVAIIWYKFFGVPSVPADIPSLPAPTNSSVTTSPSGQIPPTVPSTVALKIQ